MALTVCSHGLILPSSCFQQGVIFSVSYDPATQCICSTSDDRSVRLWFVDLQLSDGSNRLIQWKEAKITLLHTMYGHTARVWRNIVMDNVIISVGEVSFK
jgi:WD40 repeat protein